MLRFRRKSSVKCTVTHLRISSRMTLPNPTRCSGCCPPFALKDRLLKSWPELQMRIIQLAAKGLRHPGLRLPQAKFPRNSNQIARGRIRRFESDMPSQAVVSNSGGCRYTAEATTDRFAVFGRDARLRCGLRHATQPTPSAGSKPTSGRLEGG